MKKDIERVKRIKTKATQSIERYPHILAVMQELNKEDIQAIENVLKELEIKEKMNNILAKEVKDLFYGMVNELCDYETGYSINKNTDTTIENILGWARREVDNE